MDKCPFCGADYSKQFGDFECKTYKGKSRPWNRGEQCYDRQIANLKERLEAWREYGHAMRVHSGMWARAVDKLHELGEWAE